MDKHPYLNAINSGAKLGCIGAGVIAAYPFVVLAKDLGKAIIKYPRSMMLAAATTGFLWYSCPTVNREAHTLVDKGTRIVQQYRMERAEQARHENLEQKLGAVALQNQQLMQRLQQEREQNARISTRLEDIERQTMQAASNARQQASPSVPSTQATQAVPQAVQATQSTLQAPAPTPPIATPTITPAAQPPSTTPSAASIIQYQGRYAYFLVDVGDTLERISKHVCGSASVAPTIAKENGIADDRSLMAGQVLKIRAELVATRHRRLYDGPSTFKSVTLAGSKSLTDYCNGDKQCASSILALNRRLGLSYDDAFPYKRGARIVYLP